jgi:outer membrane protein assembly factor BamB
LAHSSGYPHSLNRVYSAQGDKLPTTKTLSTTPARNLRTLPIILTMIVLVFAALAFVLFLPLNNQTGAPTCTQETASGSSTELVGTPPKLKGNYSVWPTYHRDASRTGFDSSGGPLSVHAGWVSPCLDGAAYAELLVADGRLISATENNTVSSLNDSNGQIEWQRHLGTPVPRSDLPCGDIDPTGITGTPVIDSSTHTVYVVAFLRPNHQHWLFALDLETGGVKFSRVVDPPGGDPLVEQQRGALSLSNGMVYVPYGGLFGDCGEYHGWVVGTPANATSELFAYQVPTGRGGGIWAPSGGAIDSSGNVIVATGNSFSSSAFDYGDSVIKLSPSLQKLDWFAPSNWVALNNGDTDIGSVGPSLLGPDVVFQIGKDGNGYLLNESHLGGVGGGLFTSGVCDSAFGGNAYDPPFLYVPCTNGLVALEVSLGSNPSFSIAWKGPSFRAGPPIVVGGAVWVLDTDTGDIYALNAANGQVIFRYNVGGTVHFATPSAGDGQVFVAAGTKILSFILR